VDFEKPILDKLLNRPKGRGLCKSTIVSYLGGVSDCQKSLPGLNPMKNVTFKVYIPGFFEITLSQADFVVLTNNCDSRSSVSFVGQGPRECLTRQDWHSVKRSINTSPSTIVMIFLPKTKTFLKQKRFLRKYFGN